MNRYNSSFSAGLDGKEGIMMIDVVPDGVYDKVLPMTLASDPVVITYEGADLTDAIHSSQLRLTLLATEDGQYREIVGHSGIVECALALDNSPERSVQLWRGVLATRTWTEPFSREKNYSVELTFSDFGYLKRINYSPELFFGDGEDSTGFITVGTFLSRACALITVAAVLETHGLSQAEVCGTAYTDLLVSTRNFTDDEGNGLPLYDCIEKILAPAGVHIIQYKGKFHLYRPDKDTYDGIPSSMRSSLKAMGTDAELESVKLYKTVTLAYDQTPSMTLGKSVLDADDAGYEGPWQYVNNGGYRQFLLCGPEYMSGRQGYHANYIDGTRVTPCLWLVNGWAVQFKVPEGFTEPTDMPEELTDNLATMSVDFPLSASGTSRDEYPSSDEEIRITVPVLIDFAFTGNIHDVHMRASVELTPADGSPKRYLTSAGWSSSDDGSYRIHYEKQGSSDWDKSWPTPWQNLTGTIPAPSAAGLVKVTIYPSTTLTEHTYTGEITPARNPTYVQYAIQGITVEISETFTNQQISADNKVVDVFDENSEDFNKEFDMGTPVLISAGTYTGYGVPDGQSVKPDESYLNRYMDFMRSNYSLQMASRRRWKIRGTYMYDHLSGLPVFDASSTPLATLADNSFAFFLRSEEWHVRTGRSMLEIEEAYVPHDLAVFAIESDVIQAARPGGSVYYIVRTSYTDFLVSSASADGWEKAVGASTESPDLDSFRPLYSGTGDEISVQMPTTQKGYCWAALVLTVPSGCPAGRYAFSVKGENPDGTESAINTVIVTVI